MFMRPDSAALVWDALDAAQTIVTFLDGISRDEYLDDLLRRRAVEREFEIMGEALGKLRRIDPETAREIPGVRNAVALRNVLIHGYAEIVDERVYDTAIADLPETVNALAAIIAAAGEP